MKQTVIVTDKSIRMNRDKHLFFRMFQAKRIEITARSVHLLQRASALLVSINTLTLLSNAHAGSIHEYTHTQRHTYTRNNVHFSFSYNERVNRHRFAYSRS